MSNRAWMPLHIDDYLADTGHLTGAEHGAYMLMIMHYWQNGALPGNERLIARIARMDAAQWDESRDVLAMLFGPNWTHKRIDAELAKADEIIEKRRAAADARHGKTKRDANAVHVQSKSTYTGASPLTDNLSVSDANASSSPEPAKAAPVALSPTIIELPCVSGDPYPVSEADVSEWREAFPAVDIPQQLAVMRSWLNANQTRRKTRKGMRRFVVSWLDRQQNNGQAPMQRAAGPPAGKRMNAVEAYLSMKSGQTDEPAGRTIDHRDAERVSANEPRLQALLSDLGAKMQRPFGPGNH